MSTVVSWYLKSCFQSCVAYGCPPGPLLKLIDPDGDPFANPARRFPASVMIEMFAMAERLTGDVEMGIYAGAAYQPAAFLDIGLALNACATLRASAELIEKYQPLAHQIGKMKLDIEGATSYIRWRPCPEFINQIERIRPVTQTSFAAYVIGGRGLCWTRPEENVRGVFFRHRKIGDGKVTADFFNCPVTYEAGDDMLVLDTKLLDMPLPQANAGLLSVICDRLDRQLAELGGPVSIRSQTFQCIQAQMPNEPPRLRSVAKALGMSERTLRRRLADEGISFRDVADAARREACELYVREGGKSISAVAQALGYSEHSAFTRAFKRWHGAPPSHFFSA
ncbi:MAG: AraC family transcriptional regulator ligand-binding domain-containing protein [Pseudomonadota bacterium]